MPAHPLDNLNLKPKFSLSHARIMLKVKQSSRWLRTKLKRGKGESEQQSQARSQSQPPRCISIVSAVQCPARISLSGAPGNRGCVA